MNNQSPILPQGSLLEQRNKGRARVKIAVFVVLAIHGIGLMALLMQGCQKPPEAPPTPPEPTNAPPTFVEPTNPPVVPTNVPTPPTNAAVAPGTPATPTGPEVTAPAMPSGGTEYTIAKGDTFGMLAKKFHVSVKAITEANPGVDSTKLKIGQKIHIPAAPAPTAPAGVGTTPSEGLPTGGEQVYSVKSGDNLSSIAKEKATTVKAIRAANNLKTDRITVGQKLKIPVKAAAVPTGPAAATEPAPGAATSPPTATPVGR